MVFAFGNLVPAYAQKAPGIEGTYRFVSRDLPDGAVQKAPDVSGLLTFTKTYRNFNIFWKNSEGKRVSISYVAAYTLTASEYSETSIYRVTNDEIEGKGLSYDFLGQGGKAPATVENGKITIPLPLYDEPTLVFEGNTLAATKAGKFVDHWEKVK